VPWAELYRYLGANFRQGDHVAILGPTGAGKTHIAFAVAELRSYVILIACKPEDPLVDDALKRGYWLIPTDKLEVPYSDGRPLHPRVIYWPRLAEKTRRKIPDHQLLAAERAHQKPRVGAALGYVRQNGHWAVIVDEGTWVCRDLNLQRDVDSALFSFRTLNSSVIILGQRPSWMGRYVLSSPTHLFLFNTNDRDDRKALGDVSGIDSALVRDIVGELDFDRHHFLYIDTRTRTMLRSVAPPR
jgi:hypothetical protein